MTIDNEKHEVRLYGWREGALKISATKTIRKEFPSMSLAEAKDVVDRCLDGKATIFTTDSLDSAKRFVEAMSSIGFLCEVIEGDRPNRQGMMEG